MPWASGVVLAASVMRARGRSCLVSYPLDLIPIDISIELAAVEVDETALRPQ